MSQGVHSYDKISIDSPCCDMLLLNVHHNQINPVTHFAINYTINVLTQFMAINETTNPSVKGDIYY